MIGVFFKTPDPSVVADWYARVLGFPVEAWGGVAFDHPTVGQMNTSRAYPADSFSAYVAVASYSGP